MKPDELPGWQRVLVMMAMRDRRFVEFLEMLIEEVKGNDNKRKTT